MDARRLFKQSAYLIIFIFLLNFLANKFHWYYSIWWFDMFMHFTGGVWLGMVFVWFLNKRNLQLDFNFSLLIKASAWILLVGIGWEVFEYYFINYVAQNGFDRFDTVSDLLLDLSGGLCAILYLQKSKYENS